MKDVNYAIMVLTVVSLKKFYNIDHGGHLIDHFCRNLRLDWFYFKTEVTPSFITLIARANYIETFCIIYTYFGVRKILTTFTPTLA